MRPASCADKGKEIIYMTTNMIKKELSATVSPDFQGDLVAKLTTESIDRDGEVLIPQGMNAKDYEANPVLFWNHDYAQPVGKVLTLKRHDGYVTGGLKFAQRPEGYEGEFFPSFAEALVRQGIVKGVSVGFVPEENGMRNATRQDKTRYGKHVKRVFNRWKLLEVSLAPLPANQEALIQAVDKGLVDGVLAKKFLGVDVSPAKPIRKKYRINLIDSSYQIEQAELKKAIKQEIARHTGQIYY